MSRSVFQSVVVLGAAMTGCDGPRPAAPAPLSVEASTPATTSATPAPAGATPPVASAPAATATTIASAEPPAPMVTGARPKRRPCPPGSEMPDPPCFYIL